MSSAVNERRGRFLCSILAVLAGSGLIAAPSLEGCGGERARDPADAASGNEAAASAVDGAPPFGPVIRPADASPPPPPPELGFCPDALPGDAHTSEDGGPPGAGTTWQPVCLPLPEAGACGASYTQACILARYTCGLIRGGTSVDAPMSSTDACCWRVSGSCAVGRPFMIDGRVVLASLAASSAADGRWALDDAALAAELARDAASLDDATRASIADVFARDGLTEHASVASFAQHVLELLALGAPASLVLDAQRALGEEVVHAQRAFLVASAYAGATVAPGSLAVGGALRGDLTLESFATRTAAEGCVAETVAALQLHAAADAALASGQTALANVLRATAEDEMKHALLAWRVVGWAMVTGGAPVRDAVVQVLARAREHVGFGPCADEAADGAALRARGVLSQRERHELALTALEAVVAPVSRSLSSSLTTSTRGAASRMKLSH